MRHLIAPSELGAGAAFIPNLYSSSKPARKGAFVKLRTLISVLFPHIPVTGIEFISIGCSATGVDPVLIISYNPSTGQGPSNVTQP